MTDHDSEPGRLTGTAERPIERIPDAPRNLRDWGVLIGGPAIWITHFMAVYLAAEASCAALETDEWTFIGDDALVVLTVVATLVAAAACAALAWLARRRMRSHDGWKVDFAVGGALLSVGSMIGVLAVGVPAVVLSPVC